MSYLIDTNHASVFMSNQKPLTDRIIEEARRGERFYFCMPVVGELFFAIHASTQFQRNMANLQGLLSDILVLDFDISAAEEYGQIRTELKSKGRPIPMIDAQIAAIARVHNLIILSADRHFSYVTDIVLENWL